MWLKIFKWTLFNHEKNEFNSFVRNFTKLLVDIEKFVRKEKSE